MRKKIRTSDGIGNSYPNITLETINEILNFSWNPNIIWETINKILKFPWNPDITWKLASENIFDSKR